MINNIQGKSPFKVPDNYFEEVNRKILTETSDNNQEAKKSGIYFRLRPYLAIAASVAGFIIITYSTVKFITAKNTNYNISEIMAGESPELFINDIDLFSLEENAALSASTEKDSGVSSDEIIDYLLSENIEIDDIYEQL